MAPGLTYLAVGRTITDHWNHTLIVAMIVSVVVLVVTPLVLVVTPIGIGGAISAYRYGDVDINE